MKYRVIAAMGLLLGGCAMIPKRVDLSGKPSVSPFIGTVLKTEQELVVFQYRGSKAKYLGQPGVRSIPRQQEGATYPIKTHDVIVLGKAESGTEVKILKVSREDSFEMNIVDVEAEVVGPAASPWKGERLNLEPLTDIMSNKINEMPEFRSGLLKR